MNAIITIENEDGLETYKLDQKALTAIKTLLMEREKVVMMNNIGDVKNAQNKDKILKRLNHLNWWKW